MTLMIQELFGRTLRNTKLRSKQMCGAESLHLEKNYLNYEV